MIERGHPDLSIGQQCALLQIPRSSFYYAPQGETDQNLALMRLIDVQFLETPFFGVRQMTGYLRNEGHAVNEKRIRRLMRLIGLMPIYQKPNTSKPAKGHKTYPYLLRGLRVDRPNQVWCVDITYLPLSADCFAIACRATDASRVPLFGGDHGLAHPNGPVMADLKHAGRGLLRRRAERSHLSVRTAGHHEQRSGISVHVICLDGLSASVRRPHLDGRQGSLPGQHLHRAFVAHPEIRVRLSARLGDRISSPRRCSKVDGVL